MENKIPPPVSAPSTPAKDQSGNGLPKSFNDLETKRGNPRGSKPGVPRGPYNWKKKKEPGGDQGSSAPESFPGSQFTPENCKYLVELPYNLAFVRTGFTGFLLNESESATLSAGASTVLNVWVNVDPKWAALIMFSISLASISAAKIMGYKVALAELEARKKPANGGAQVPESNGHKPPETA